MKGAYTYVPLHACSQSDRQRDRIELRAIRAHDPSTKSLTFGNDVSDSRWHFTRRLNLPSFKYRFTCEVALPEW